MGIRPNITLVMGVDDLAVDTHGRITDLRMAVPAWVPSELTEDGAWWWQQFGYDDPMGRITLPPRYDGSFVGMSPRLTDHILWQQQIRQAFTTTDARDTHEIGKRFEDVLFWSPESGPPNVMGVPIDDDTSPYNATWLWALCDVMGEAWMQPGYHVVPSTRLEDDRSYDALALRVMRGMSVNGRRPKPIREPRDLRRSAARKAKLLKNGWNVGSLVCYIETYAAYAGYVLRQIGLQHRAADLKLMIVRTWGVAGTTQA
jgi:hypothetical protein